MNFEENLKSLESKVAKMESGELTLDEMIRQFEEGQKLVSECQKELAEIKVKIEKVVAAGQ